MPPYTNETGISLSMAVYLAHDQYDYNDDPNTISATALIKPLRQIILGARVPEQEQVTDISTILKSRLGTSIHDGLERAWMEGNYRQAMESLGYPKKIIDRIVVNPESEVSEDMLPVYLEKRSTREIEGFKVSGKFDFLADGRIEDLKTTSTFVYANQSNFKSYQLQGSIYRWLNPEIVTKDHMAIQFVFMDFKPMRAGSENYPNNAVQQQIIPLFSIQETEQYIRNKLRAIVQNKDLPETDLPRCSDEDLWRRPPHYKYYKNPDKMTRSTKNFDNQQEAMTYQAKNGGVGLIVKKPGEVVACKYCPAFSVCTQKNEYIADGSLKV